MDDSITRRAHTAGAGRQDRSLTGSSRSVLRQRSGVLAALSFVLAPLCMAAEPANRPIAALRFISDHFPEIFGALLVPMALVLAILLRANKRLKQRLKASLAADVQLRTCPGAAADGADSRPDAMVPGAAAAPVTPHRRNEEQQAPTSKLRDILVVDDDAVNQLVIRELLDHLGHRALAVGTGKAALDLLAQQRFDLLLTDCQMPEMDGFELSRRVREMRNDDNGRIPIVALTASTDPRIEDLCREAGMDKVMAKPVGLHDLRTLLNEAWLAKSPLI